MAAVRPTVLRSGRFVIAAVAVTGTLTGCASQIAALAPVGGDAVTTVRTAAIDVVTGHGLLVKEAPRCTATTDGFSCVGAVTDGSAIVVSAPLSAETLRVQVGGRVLYDGSVQAVLDAAAQGSPPPVGGDPVVGG